MDERHDTPSGPAVKKLCERALLVFGQTEYERLAQISVSHLYNLRKSVPYTRKRRHFEKTRSRQIPIGERRKPAPNGRPGYIRPVRNSFTPYANRISNPAEGGLLLSLFRLI